MRFLPAYQRIVLAAVVAVAAIATGCDSGSEDDADPFVGTWEVSRVRVNGQDVTAIILTQIESIGADFTSDGSFELTVVVEGAAEVTRGSYSIDEEASSITFTSSGFETPVVLSFERAGSSQVVLSSDDATLLVALAGIDPDAFGFEVESVEVTISRT